MVLISIPRTDYITKTSTHTHINIERKKYVDFISSFIA